LGALTPFLQLEFSRLCPPGWRSTAEVPLLSRDTAGLLGYAPRADLLLERLDRTQRIWIEFEVSRADPVSNHVKFATGHLFEPQPTSDAFLAMVSPHVSRGRRNLAANTVALMRHVGMNAFQTMLFPRLMPDEVKHLNHLNAAGLRAAGLSVAAEIQRALIVTAPVMEAGGYRVYFASDLIDVLVNVRRWNEEIHTPGGRSLWGRRMVTYFAFDPVSRLFAPSKFAAFMPLSTRPVGNGGVITPGPYETGSTMSLQKYVNIERCDSRFDGHRAKTHLVENLAMVPMRCRTKSDIQGAMNRWLADHKSTITIHPLGPIALIPPSWFH
jgi:hypothetical protein